MLEKEREFQKYLLLARIRQRTMSYSKGTNSTALPLSRPADVIARLWKDPAHEPSLGLGKNMLLKGK